MQDVLLLIIDKTSNWQFAA